MSMIGNYVRISPALLADLRANPESVMALLYPDDLSEPKNHLDIDKAWHAIHFLLNGQPWEGEWPLVNAVLGGEPIGETDVGYGPARYLEPADVRAIADAVSAISSAELLERLDPSSLNDAKIYPQGWNGEEHERKYIAGNYERLVEFLRGAADAGDAVIEYLN